MSICFPIVELPAGFLACSSSAPLSERLDGYLRANMTGLRRQVIGPHRNTDPRKIQSSGKEMRQEIYIS